MRTFGSASGRFTAFAPNEKSPAVAGLLSDIVAAAALLRLLPLILALLILPLFLALLALLLAALLLTLALIFVALVHLVRTAALILALLFALLGHSQVSSNVYRQRNQTAAKGPCSGLAGGNPPPSCARATMPQRGPADTLPRASRGRSRARP
jgi:hypothetical protein